MVSDTVPRGGQSYMTQRKLDEYFDTKKGKSVSPFLQIFNTTFKHWHTTVRPFIRLRLRAPSTVSHNGAKKSRLAEKEEVIIIPEGFRGILLLWQLDIAVKSIPQLREVYAAVCEKFPDVFKFTKYDGTPALRPWNGETAHGDAAQLYPSIFNLADLIYDVITFEMQEMQADTRLRTKAGEVTIKYQPIDHSPKKIDPTPSASARKSRGNKRLWTTAMTIAGTDQAILFSALLPDEEEPAHDGSISVDDYQYDLWVEQMAEVGCPVGRGGGTVLYEGEEILNETQFRGMIRSMAATAAKDAKLPLEIDYEE